MYRTRAWRRHKDYTKAKRKRHINYFWANSWGLPCWHYDNLHQYSKNKIHCSCPMCSSKTRNKGRHKHRARGWAPALNYSIKDKRRIESMEFDFFENS